MLHDPSAPRLRSLLGRPRRAGSVSAGLRRPRGVATESYPAWIAKLEPKLVDLELPRWKTRTSAHLRAPLQALGMKRAFDSTADFGGMADGHGLFISDVIHQAFIEVNEAGTEAAAATAVIMHEESFHQPPEKVVFHADRPFLYLLREPQTDAILFLGRVVDPT